MRLQTGWTATAVVGNTEICWAAANLPDNLNWAREAPCKLWMMAAVVFHTWGLDCTGHLYHLQDHLQDVVVGISMCRMESSSAAGWDSAAAESGRMLTAFSGLLEHLHLYLVEARQQSTVRHGTCSRQSCRKAPRSICPGSLLMPGRRGRLRSLPRWGVISQEEPVIIRR